MRQSQNKMNLDPVYNLVVKEEMGHDSSNSSSSSPDVRRAFICIAVTLPTNDQKMIVTALNKVVLMAVEAL